MARYSIIVSASITRRAALVLSTLILCPAVLNHSCHLARASTGIDGARSAAGANARAEQAAKNLSHFIASQHGQLTLSVVSLASGRVVADINGDRALNPASNMKLLTAAAVLNGLGPERKFETRLHGRAEGDTIPRLTIWSNGDPSLDSSALADLALQLVRRGIRIVQKIVVDQSYFDEKYVPPGFEQGPKEWAAFRAPVSAVAFDHNTVSVSVYTTSPGAPARVVAFPPSFVTLSAHVKTGHAEVTSPQLVLDAASAVNGVKISITGVAPPGSAPTRFSRRVEDPRLLPGYALADTLRILGVQVSQPVELGSHNQEPILAERQSPELSVLLQALGKDSDNFTAEMLVKALGAFTTSSAGTTNDGLRVLRKYAEGLGPLAPGTRFINGSGLFDADRISARLLTQVLRAARRDSLFGPEYVASLSIAGHDGTLKQRLTKQVTQGVIRAKTGTLNQAVSLSGYIDAKQVKESNESSRVWVFSVIVNGTKSTGIVRQKIDEFVDDLLAAMLSD